MSQSIVIHVSVVLRQGNDLLLVQEGKPENYERWNLPGGHLELGESVVQGAIREVAEETNLTVIPSELVGIYTTIRQPEYQALRFVFAAQYVGEPRAGDDILAVRWFSPEEIDAMLDDQLVGGKRLRHIVADVISNRRYPLATLAEPNIVEAEVQ